MSRVAGSGLRRSGSSAALRPQPCDDPPGSPALARDSASWERAAGQGVDGAPSLAAIALAGARRCQLAGCSEVACR